MHHSRQSVYKKIDLHLRPVRLSPTWRNMPNSLYGLEEISGIDAPVGSWTLPAALANKVARTGDLVSIRRLKQFLESLRSSTDPRYAFPEKYEQLATNQSDDAPRRLRVLKMAIESSEANEYRSKCLRRISGRAS